MKKVFMNLPSSDRRIFLDYLRVFSIFAVIFLHTSAQHWRDFPVTSFEWKTYNFYDSLVRFAVPAFIMISGALFLSRDISIKKLYSKYILRLGISYFVWSYISFWIEGFGKQKNLNTVLEGYYHLWFIPILIGLYMLVPFFKKIIKENSLTKYFLILSFIFAFFIPTLKVFANDFGNNFLIDLSNATNLLAVKLRLGLVLGFSGYFVLGYYLSETNFSKRQRIIIYLLGVIGVFLTIYLNMKISIKQNMPLENYYNAFKVNVLLASISIFVFFKYRKFNNDKLNMFFMSFSKYMFGIYLVHAMVLKKLYHWFHFSNIIFNPIFSIPLIAITVFLISFIISFLLNKIPFFKKYIV